MWTLLLSAILIGLVYGDDLQLCPPNLHRSTALRTYNGHCYEFMIHRHVPWSTAENDCGSKGGTLVAINNIEEQTFMMSALRSFPFHGQGVWIGLTDSAQEGKFTWVTGEATSFAYWAPGQPGLIANIGRKRFLLDSLPLPHLVEEDCVLLKYSDSGHWHDYPCSQLDLIGLLPENFPYVCEYKQIPRPTTTTMRPSTPNPTTIPTITIPTTTIPTTTLPPTTTPEPDIVPTTTSGSVSDSVGELVIG